MGGDVDTRQVKKQRTDRFTMRYRVVAFRAGGEPILPEGAHARRHRLGRLRSVVLDKPVVDAEGSAVWRRDDGRRLDSALEGRVVDLAWRERREEGGSLRRLLTPTLRQMEAWQASVGDPLRVVHEPVADDEKLSHRALPAEQGSASLELSALALKRLDVGAFLRHDIGGRPLDELRVSQPR